MADRRQQYDRRKNDRRQSPPKKTVHPLVYLLLGGILASTAFWFYYESQTVDWTSIRSSRATSGTVRRSNKNNEYEEFRKSVLERDLELRNKLTEKKESRKTNIGSYQARQHYEKRLAELEDELRIHDKFSNKKNSIGWDLKRQIKNMRTDAPPE